MSTKRTRILRAEQCEPRHLLAAYTFTPHTIIEGAGAFVSTLAADVDGDGDADLLSASISDDKVAWYENTDGRGTFGSQQVITDTADGAVDVYAADLDGDGDIDVISASAYDDTIAWYENTDGRGSFGTQQVITTEADQAQAVFAIDVDGDKDIDVLSASAADDTIAWYENTDGRGTFGPRQVITDSADQATSVYAADLDQDGDIDVLSSSHQDGKIAWYENDVGRGEFGAQRIIATTEGAADVHAADIDGDGDVDVLSASNLNDEVAWHENKGVEGTLFGQPQVITTAADGVVDVHTVDFDQDGDIDVLTASTEDGKVAWYENQGEEGSFGAQQVVTTAAAWASSVDAADFDDDGDLDVLASSYQAGMISWYEVNDATTDFGVPHVVTTSTNTAHAYPADLDGDGDIDIVGEHRWTQDVLAWYENVDGGTFSTRFIVTDTAGVGSVYTADLDGDDDLDVLVASSPSLASHLITWHENLDGKGQFGEQRVITTEAKWATRVIAADIDGDGDNDVISTSIHDGDLAWYENLDGNATFGPEQVIHRLDPHQNGLGPYDVKAVDLDRDGDTDLISAWRPGSVAWHENTNGKGAFGPPRAIETATAYRTARIVDAADLDGDGDADVVAFLSNGDIIAWYENTDGLGTFGVKRIIDTEAPPRLIAVDLDHDGDVDIAAAGDTRTWYENKDGRGTFGPARLISNSVGSSTQSLYAADIDGDEHLDVVASGRRSQGDYEIVWYENQLDHNRVIGDSNGDGVFNSSDLVAVFQASEYEDGIPGNSTWNEGDWNGDGDFDSSDLVLAFQAGTYQLEGATIATWSSLFDPDRESTRKRSSVLGPAAVDKVLEDEFELRFGHLDG